AVVGATRLAPEPDAPACSCGASRRAVRGKGGPFRRAASGARAQRQDTLVLRRTVAGASRLPALACAAGPCSARQRRGAHYQPPRGGTGGGDPAPCPVGPRGGDTLR